MRLGWSGVAAIVGALAFAPTALFVAAWLDAAAPLSGNGDVESLLNPSFEEWISGRPWRWEIRDAHERLVRVDTESVYDGRYALRSDPASYYNNVNQSLRVNNAAGRELWFSAWARCSEPNSLSLSMEIAGHGSFVSAYHPGDGEWHEVAVGTRVPAFHLGEEVTVSISHGGQPKQPAWIDAARMTLR